jgi:hypothetical protein
MVERDGFATVTTTNVYHSPCNFRLIDLLFYQYFLDAQIILFQLLFHIKRLQSERELLYTYV